MHTLGGKDRGQQERNDATGQSGEEALCDGKKFCLVRPRRVDDHLLWHKGASTWSMKSFCSWEKREFAARGPKRTAAQPGHLES